jgi:hemoglobin-like flavoprotein/NAD(P)H-flavin reductase
MDTVSYTVGIMPGDLRRDGSSIETYDQWLAWEDSLRLRRNKSGRHRHGPTPAVTDTSQWGDQALLEASLAVVAPMAAHIVPFFYHRLFTEHPYLRPMFPAKMDEQNERLLNALLALVNGVTDPDSLVGVLEQLGRDHRKFGVREVHFAAVGKALIATLVHFAGSAWTAAIQQAWLDRYTFAVTTMMAAAEADDQPPYWYATVVNHKQVTQDVAILHMRPRHPYLWEPGQTATIASGKLSRVWRPYAVAAGSDELEFHVKAANRGGLSDILVRDTAVGDTVRLGAPMGDSLLVPSGGRTRLMVSDGTGWAQVKALLARLPRSADRVFAVHIEADGLPYDPEWQQTLDRCPGVSAVVVRSAAQAVAQLPAELADRVHKLERNDAFQAFWPLRAAA